jgi:hypothetical protein
VNHYCPELTIQIDTPRRVQLDLYSTITVGIKELEAPRRVQLDLYSTITVGIKELEANGDH